MAPAFPLTRRDWPRGLLHGVIHRHKDFRGASSHIHVCLSAPSPSASPPSHAASKGWEIDDPAACVKGAFVLFGWKGL